MSDNINTNTEIHPVYTIPEFTEAISWCEEAMINSDDSACQEKGEKGGLGEGIIQCNDRLEQAWDSYYQRMIEEETPVEVFYDDVPGLAEEASKRAYDANMIITKIAVASDPYGLQKRHYSLFSDYISAYAEGLFAKEQICGETVPAGFMEEYNILNPSSPANCAQLVTRFSGVEQTASLIGCGPDPTRKSPKEFLQEHGDLAAFGEGRFQENRSVLGAGVEGGLSFDIPSTPLFLGFDASLLFYADFDYSLNPKGEVKTIGLEFIPPLFKFGFHKNNFSLNLEGGYWPNLFAITPPDQADVPYDDNLFNNHNWQISTELLLEKQKLMIELGVRGDPYGTGGFVRAGVNF
jgi:hypothetical protein